MLFSYCFAQAQALADEAEQGEGDAGTELFAQAARAHAEAEELERAAQQAAAELAENGALSTREKIALASQVGRSRRLKQVAALCGRLTRIALHVQSTRVHYPPDEVADIRYGSDIGHVLPSELALLADPTLEALFFHRYAEGQLIQYELIGNEKQGQGPIILAINTSGSMTESLGGIAKDVWAKAVMLALVAIARLQERDMVAFLFSGSAHELTRFDFPKGRAPHQTVITAVETFYNGGTVFEPWDEAQRLGQKYMERRGMITDAMIARHLASAMTLAAPAAVDNRAQLLPLDIDAGGIAAIHALIAEAMIGGSFADRHE